MPHFCIHGFHIQASNLAHCQPHTNLGTHRCIAPACSPPVCCISTTDGRHQRQAAAGRGRLRLL